MMSRAGLLTEPQLADVEALTRAQGRPFVEAVLELGLIDEHRLAEFLQNKLMIPWATAEVLDRLDRSIVERIPGQLARQRCVLPVSLDDNGNLTVAMADPTDVRAADEVTAHTGTYLVRAVACISQLRSAIVRYYDQGSESRPVTMHDTSAAAEWEPELAPLSAEAFERVLPRLVATTNRDEITQVLLDFLGAGFARVILFSHANGELRGHDARGSDLLVTAVKQVRIPAGGASVFSEVIARRTPHFGPLRTDTPINHTFAQALGGVVGNVLVLPVMLRDKTPLLVFASGTTHPVDPRSIKELAVGVSAALERHIVGQKLRAVRP